MLALQFHHVWSLFFMLQEDSSVGWDPVHLWAQMGGLARGVFVSSSFASAASSAVVQPGPRPSRSPSEMCEGGSGVPGGAMVICVPQISWVPKSRALT